MHNKPTIALKWEQIQQLYTFDFEAVIGDKAASAVLESYLSKEEFNAEPLLFLRAVDAFKVMIGEEQRFFSNNADELKEVFHHISEQIFQIRDTFIKKQSRQELNLPYDVRDKLFTTIDNTCQQMNNFLQHLSSKEEATTSVISSNELHTTICHLFSKVEVYILYQLKFDSFRRFVRSQIWKHFICRQPRDVLEKLAISADAAVKKKVPLLTKADMLDPTISERIVEYVTTQACEDGNHWKLGFTGYQGKCTFYYTPKKFFAGDVNSLLPEMRNMHISKCVYYFEASMNEVILLCTGKETHFDRDPNITFTDTVEYLPISETRKYASQITRHQMKLGPLFQLRHISSSWTALYDQVQDQVVLIAKTCEHEKAPLPKKHLKVHMLLGLVVKKMSDTVTRLVMFQQINSGGLFKYPVVNPLSNILLEQRAVTKYTTYNRLLEAYRQKDIKGEKESSNWTGIEEGVTSTYHILDTLKDNINAYGLSPDPELWKLKHTNFAMQ